MVLVDEHDVSDLDCESDGEDEDGEPAEALHEGGAVHHVLPAVDGGRPGG